jgi:hypothetical protein
VFSNKITSLIKDHHNHFRGIIKLQNKLPVKLTLSGSSSRDEKLHKLFLNLHTSHETLHKMFAKYNASHKIETLNEVENAKDEYNKVCALYASRIDKKDQKLSIVKDISCICDSIIWKDENQIVQNLTDRMISIKKK